MVSEKFVDVIIPTYNRASSIRSSIESVLNQTYEYVRVFVVDDCSNDSTLDVISTIKDERLHYKGLQSRKGANYCRNLGASMGTSEYIAFNDSDDQWIPEKLEVQLNILRNNAPGMVFSPYIFRDDRGDKIVGQCSEEDIDNIQKRLICEGNVVGTPTILLNRQVFDAVGGFDCSLPRQQDWEFVLRLTRAFPIYYYNSPLVIASDGRGRISADRSAYNEACRKIVTRNADLIAKHSVVLKYIRMCDNIGMSGNEICDEFLLNTGLKQTDIIKMLSREYLKMTKYYHMTADLHRKKNLIESYLKSKCIHNIALYGYTGFSICLAETLNELGYAISAIIDKRLITSEKYVVMTPDDYKMNDVLSDIIIVTVPSLFGKVDQKTFHQNVIDCDKLLIDE